MLRSKDINAEVKKLDDKAKASEKDNPVQSAVLKALSLIIKTLRDIRSNQVTDLKSRNVKLIEDNKQGTNEKKETK